MQIIDQLILKVRELAAASPDCTYGGGNCRYESGLCSNGTTGCLLGQALTLLGYKPEGSSLIEYYLPKLGIEADYKQIKWLGYVQGEQDVNRPWKDCIAFGDRKVDLQSEGASGSSPG